MLNNVEFKTVVKDKKLILRAEVGIEKILDELDSRDFFRSVEHELRNVLVEKLAHELFSKIVQKIDLPALTNAVSIGLVSNLRGKLTEG